MKILTLLVAALLLAGCSTPATIRSQGATTRLVLLDPAGADAELDKFPVPTDTDGYNDAGDAAIRDLCAPTVVRAKFVDGVAPGLLLDLVVKPLIAQLIGKIEKRIAAELDAYSASYGAAITTDSFYLSADPRLVPAYSCFRFTRLTADKKPALDLVGQFRLTADRGALLVRPLRLHVSGAKAKGDRVGFAIALASESVWLDGASRKQEQTFDIVLINEARKLQSPSVKYYFDKADLNNPTGFHMVKLVPWTRRNGHSGNTGNVTLTVTVAETGNAPRYLKQIQKVFADRKDELGKLLEKSAAAVLGAD